MERLPNPRLPDPWRIRRMQKENHDTFTMELEPASRGSGLSAAPGQFNMVYAFGVGEVPISVSGDSALIQRLVHTVREVGTVTRALKAMKRGSVLGIRGPFGNPWPLGEAEGKDVAVIAGGLGLAPLRPVLYALLATRKQYGRIVILYGARSPGDLLYVRELKKWQNLAGLQVEVTVDSAGKDWNGRVGVVTTLIPGVSLDSSRTLAMVCGPEVMMRFTLAELRKAGLEAKDIFISMERNMKCALGYCGHCQFGPAFICKDGPVFRYDRIQDWFLKREI